MAGRPDTSLSVEVTDANGVTTRWGSEDRTPSTVPRDLRFSTKRMDGFADANVTLSRRIDQDILDAGLLDTVRFIAADGSIAYEGRVGAMPRSVSDHHELELQLTGWMSHARDQAFTDVFVDRDMSRWHATPLSRRINLATAGLDTTRVSVQADNTGLMFEPAPEALEVGWAGELHYDAGPHSIQYLGYRGTRTGPSPFTNFEDPTLFSSDSEDLGGAASQAITLDDTTRTATLSPATRYLMLRLYVSTLHTPPSGMLQHFSKVAAYGDHGLTHQPVADGEPGGFTASQVIEYLANRYCPMLDTTNVSTTTYAIPHLVYRDLTDPYDAFLEVNKYHLWDLAVWENRTLHYRPISLEDYDWEIRIEDPGTTVSLQGPTLQDLCNGVNVQYRNVITGAEELLLARDYAELRDDTIENDATRHGVARPKSYRLSYPTTPEAALQAGRAALAEFNLPKAPGNITCRAHVRDREGNWQPAHRVRAGDRVIIADHPNDSPRIVQETGYDHAPGTVSLAVDSEVRMLEAVSDRVTTALMAAGLA